MYKVKLISVICWILYFSGSAVPAPCKNDKLSWLSLQEAEAACKKEKKPILIDLYTNWCGWCRVMDRKTYSNKNVINYLREKFYIVRLNAESKERVSWGGKTFDYNEQNRTNDIALYLTQGRLSYPTTVLISSEGSDPQAIPGFLTPKEIEILLKYFGENKFGHINFDDYSKDFKPEWK